MPNFKLKETELKSRLDKWLYFIQHLEDFQNIPAIFSDEVFNQAFEKAELARFEKSEMLNCHNSLKIYRDLKGVIDTAFEEGKLEVAKNLKNLGIEINSIVSSMGLPKEIIEKL
jgi:hypothetical protein